MFNPTIYDKVRQLFAAGQWFFRVLTTFSSTNKSGGQDITEILLKVPLNTIILTLPDFHISNMVKRKLTSLQDFCTSFFPYIVVLNV